MASNIVEKIIGNHLVSGEMKAGSEISIRIDHTLTQDALGTMAYLHVITSYSIHYTKLYDSSRRRPSR